MSICGLWIREQRLARADLDREFLSPSSLTESSPSNPRRAQIPGTSTNNISPEGPIDSWPCLEVSFHPVPAWPSPTHRAVAPPPRRGGFDRPLARAPYLKEPPRSLFMVFLSIKAQSCPRPPPSGKSTSNSLKSRRTANLADILVRLPGIPRNPQTSDETLLSPSHSF
jgi:hypothetical protein